MIESSQFTGVKNSNFLWDLFENITVKRICKGNVKAT